VITAGSDRSCWTRNYIDRGRKLLDELNYLVWKRKGWKLAPDIAHLVAKRMAEIVVELEALAVARQQKLRPRMCRQRSLPERSI
jgi:hypothetical protein